jgi:Cu(I)/Ag(I) efflux system periplasmic protein CusF
MKRRTGTMLAAAALALAPLAHAGSHQSAAFTEAEVRKVDKAAGKVTLKHGPIANLEMPPMTMVFRVKDAAMLDQVKAGDKVRFKAEKIQGAYTVTEVAPPAK